MRNFLAVFFFLFSAFTLEAQIGLRPNFFTEETNPTNSNFEVYSQKNGLTRRASLDNIKKWVAPFFNPDTIAYIPTSWGNTTDLASFVYDSTGLLWYIDGQGDAVSFTTALGTDRNGFFDVANEGDTIAINTVVFDNLTLTQLNGDAQLQMGADIFDAIVESQAVIAGDRSILHLDTLGRAVIGVQLGTPESYVGFDNAVGDSIGLYVQINSALPTPGQTLVAGPDSLFRFANLSSGLSDLNDLGDVDTSGLSIDNLLRWNGTDWVPVTTTQIIWEQALVYGQGLAGRTTYWDTDTTLNHTAITYSANEWNAIALTGAVGVPSGTVAQRPTGAAGKIRFNSDLGDLEFYNGSAWRSLPESSANAFTAGEVIIANPAGILTDTTAAAILSMGGALTGSGTSGTVPLWSGTTALGNSSVTESGQVLSSSFTGAFRPPLGTTGERPANAAGLLRWNSTLGDMEFNTGSLWRSIPEAMAGTFTAGEIGYFNSAGVLTDTTIAAILSIGGAPTGSGVANRVAYWSGTSTLTSHANLLWDGSEFIVGGTDFGAYNAQFLGSWRFQSALSNPGTVTMAGNPALAVAANFSTGVALQVGQGDLVLTTTGAQLLQQSYSSTNTFGAILENDNTGLSTSVEEMLVWKTGAGGGVSLTRAPLNVGIGSGLNSAYTGRIVLERFIMGTINAAGNNSNHTKYDGLLTAYQHKIGVSTAGMADVAYWGTQVVTSDSATYAVKLVPETMVGGTISKSAAFYGNKVYIGNSTTPSYTLDVAAGGMRLAPQSAAPVGAEGLMYWDSDAPKGMLFYNGTRYSYIPESTIPAFTATRVPFADANGQLTQDGGLVYDAANDDLTVAHGVYSHNFFGFTPNSTTTFRSANSAGGMPAASTIYGSGAGINEHNAGHTYLRGGGIQSGPSSTTANPGDVYIQTYRDPDSLNHVATLRTHLIFSSEYGGRATTQIVNRLATTTGTQVLTMEGDTLKYRVENVGAISTTTDGSGDVTVTHSMGTTPTAVLVTPTGTTPWIVSVHTIGATTFKVRFYDAAGAAVTTTAVTATWLGKT